ncbi:peptidase dimerization domain-containing protein, partial [Nocardia cyriacigeorgica]|uniref:peptidase dimerization domain-containing protein n=1 Tax=Nocardia cyriacigeorgica TaxID=135487 RepID=UPI002455B55F
MVERAGYRGGVKANVLPQHAEALINSRILPGDSVGRVLEHCRRVVARCGCALRAGRDVVGAVAG